LPDWSGRLRAFHTTGKRLALFLASKSYDNDYNVLLARFPSSFLIWASVRLGFEQYLIVKVRLIFQLYHPTKGTIVKLKNEPIFTKG